MPSRPRRLPKAPDLLLEGLISNIEKYDLRAVCRQARRYTARGRSERRFFKRSESPMSTGVHPSLGQCSGMTPDRAAMVMPGASPRPSTVPSVPVRARGRRRERRAPITIATRGRGRRHPSRARRGPSRDRRGGPRGIRRTPRRGRVVRRAHSGVGTVHSGAGVGRRGLLRCDCSRPSRWGRTAELSLTASQRTLWRSSSRSSSSSSIRPLPLMPTFPRPHRDHTSTAFSGRYGRDDSHG